MLLFREAQLPMSALPHSSALKPTNTISLPTSIGRLTNIPSLANSCNCSFSVSCDSLSFNPNARYWAPLVFQNRLIGNPLASSQERN